MPQNRLLSRKMENSKGPGDRPEREEAADPSMYRPISLLNTEMKILENILIKRMHHFYKTDALNENQFGFSPQKKHGRCGHGS